MKMNILTNKWIILIFILAVAGIIIFTNFLTRPKIWSDEGLMVQLTRNWAEAGEMKIAVGPNQFSPNQHYFNSSAGWVAPASVALFFKISSVSFFNARLAMAFYLLGLIAVVFLLARRLWGLKTAIFSSLLLVSFAPLYGNGKSVLAEVPALFWLALGFYLYEVLRSKPMLQSILSGLGFGMFFAAKPAYLILGLPVLAVVHLITLLRTRKDAITFAAAKVILFWLLIFLVIAPTIWRGVIHPINFENILKTAGYYSNNYGSPCVSCDIQRNLSLFLTHKTLWHLAFLIIVAGLYLILNRKEFLKEWRIQWLAIFGLFVLFYFLKSPAVFRYFFPLQIILLCVLPFCLLRIFEKIKPNFFWIGYAAVAILIIIQFVHLGWFKTMYHSTAPVFLEQYIKENILPTDKIVGIIGSPVAAAAMPAGRYYQFVQFVTSESFGITDGINALDLPDESLPDYLIYQTPFFIFRGDTDYYARRIETFYEQAVIFQDYIVMEKKSCQDCQF